MDTMVPVYVRDKHKHASRKFSRLELPRVVMYTQPPGVVIKGRGGGRPI